MPFCQPPRGSATGTDSSPSRQPRTFRRRADRQRDWRGCSARRRGRPAASNRLPAPILLVLWSPGVRGSRPAASGRDRRGASSRRRAPDAARGRCRHSLPRRGFGKSRRKRGTCPSCRPTPAASAASCRNERRRTRRGPLELPPARRDGVPLDATAVRLAARVGNAGGPAGDRDAVGRLADGVSRDLAGGDGLAGGISNTAPQEGHFPFLPAIAAGVRTVRPHCEQGNSILSEASEPAGAEAQETPAVPRRTDLRWPGWQIPIHNGGTCLSCPPNGPASETTADSLGNETRSPSLMIPHAVGIGSFNGKPKASANGADRLTPRPAGAFGLPLNEEAGLCHPQPRAVQHRPTVRLPTSGYSV